MDKCVKDVCKKTCEDHSEHATSIAVLGDRVSYAWRITNIIVLLGMAVIGYTHVRGANFERDLTNRAASIETDVAKIEERVTGIKETMAANHEDLIRRLRTLNKMASSMAKMQGEDSSSLFARDF